MPWEEHLVDGAGQALGMQGGDAQEHIAHVADAGIADNELQVSLGKGRNCPIYDVDGGKYDQHELPVLGALGEEVQADADDTEGPELHKDAGVKHAD